VKSVDGAERGAPRAESARWWSALVRAAENDLKSRNAPVWDAVQQAYSGRSNAGGKPDYGGVEITNRGKMRQSRVRPPRMYSLVSGMETMLYHRRPKFFVRAYEGRNEKLAQDFERLGNVMWRRFVSSKEMRWIIRDTALKGRGWGLLGYEFDEDEERSALNERMSQARSLNESAMAAVVPVEEMAQSSAPVTPEENEVEPETYEGDSRSRARRPSFRRLPPCDVTYDPDAMTVHDAGWIDYRCFVSLDSLRADPFMRNAKKVKPVGRMDRGPWKGIRGGDVIQSPAEFPRGGAKSGQSYEYAEIHYTAVKREGGTWDVLIYAHDHDFFLRKLKAPYWFGCPFVTLAWNDDGDTLETIGDGERLLPGIVEEAGIRSRLKDHWNRKPNDVAFIDDRLFNNQSNRAAIEVQGVASIIPVKVPGETGLNQMPLSNHIFPLQRTSTLGDVYQHLQLVDRDFMAVTGLGPNQQLQAMKSETSSYEAQEVARNARARGVEKQEAVEEFCAQVDHMLLMLAAQFFRAERVAEFVSGEAAARWRTYYFTPGDVQDGLGVEVERGSMRPQSSDAREALFSSLMQLALSNPAFAAKLNIEEVFKRLTEERGILDGSALLNANVDLQQMVVAMMQMQLMGGGKGGAAPKQRGGSTEVPA